MRDCYMRANFLIIFLLAITCVLKVVRKSAPLLSTYAAGASVLLRDFLRSFLSFAV